MTSSVAVTSNHLPAVTDSLASYVRYVYRIPPITHQEERELFKRLTDHNDLKAAQRLVMSHLRYVVRIAYDYRGYGLPVADLIQEGTIGLMKAIKRFDPTVETRLITFAIHWIKAKIRDFVVKNWRLVRVATTKQQLKLFFNLRRMIPQMTEDPQQSLNPDQIDRIAEKLNVKAKDVAHMELMMGGHDESFDASPSSYDSEYHPAPEHYLEAVDSDPASLVEQADWLSNQTNCLEQAFERLDDRSRDILKSRRLCEDGEKLTLQVLGKRYGISPERVRQLENEGMKKLKVILSEALL